MRVKLSYTVEEEDVLKEGAKILNLSADDVQQCIMLFQEIQKTLAPAEAAETPNVPKALEMVDEFRRALLNVDTRLLELTEIVTGYEDYQKQQRNALNESVLPEGE